MDDLYAGALSFWDKWYGSEEPKKDEDQALGCALLEERLSALAARGRVLDFGCGAGWSSRYMTYRGAKEVLGIDQSRTAIDASVACAGLSGCADTLRYVCDNEQYLQTLPEGCFDGAFSSNTLDVIPAFAAQSVLEQIHRALAPNAPFLMMLNPYVDAALAEQIHLVPLGDAQYAIGGVLRCVNRTDKEWEAFVSPWFAMEQSEIFRFDGEPEERRRRLLSLRRK